MGLSGRQRKQLKDALVDAFPTKSSLEQMLSFELDKNLEAIAGEGSLQEIIFKTIQTAEAEGWIEDLIRAARRANPKNSKLQVITQTPGSELSSRKRLQQLLLRQVSTEVENRISSSLYNCIHILPNWAKASLLTIVVLTLTLSIVNLNDLTWDKKQLELSQVLYGKDNDKNFMSITLNNKSNDNRIIKKIVYSRGKSTLQERLIDMCCPYCDGTARYVVDEFNIYKKYNNVKFHPENKKYEKYLGNAIIADGCTDFLYAQVELPVAIAIKKNSLFEIRIYFNIQYKSNKEITIDKDKNFFSLKEILAKTDEVCTYVYSDSKEQLKSCIPEKKVPKLFL
jgi:hypothetical protein